MIKRENSGTRFPIQYKTVIGIYMVCARIRCVYSHGWFWKTTSFSHLFQHAPENWENSSCCRTHSCVLYRTENALKWKYITKHICTQTHATVIRWYDKSNNVMENVLIYSRVPFGCRGIAPQYIAIDGMYLCVHTNVEMWKLITTNTHTYALAKLRNAHTALALPGILEWVGRKRSSGTRKITYRSSPERKGKLTLA